MTDLKYRELTDQILRVFYRTYRELGGGFVESVYQRVLLIALDEAGLHAKGEVAVPVWFHGRDVGQFRADIIVENLVLLELKAAEAICDAHRAQTTNYLRATDLEIALILNFGPQPDFKRIVYDNNRKKSAHVRARPRTSAVGV